MDPAAAAHVAIDGALLYTEWRRPPVPDRPTLVFLHDGLGSIETLRRFPDILAETCAMGAFAYDRWGYGRSDRRESFPPLFMEDEAGRLERLLDAVGIGECVLVGHSDGGTVALLHAARHPARVRAVVTMAAHIRRDRLTLDQVLRHQRMVDTGDIPDWMTRFHGARAAHLLACWTQAWQQPEYGTWDIGRQIAAIRCPLLALQGADDAYGLADQIADIARAVPGCRTLMLAGVGHFPHLEAAERAVEIVAEFVIDACR